MKGNSEKRDWNEMSLQAYHSFFNVQFSNVCASESGQGEGYKWRRRGIKKKGQVYKPARHGVNAIL